MIITRYQQKQYAISQMQNLFFDDEVINAFNKANKVPFFKNGILSDMPKEIQEKLKIILPVPLLKFRIIRCKQRKSML